MNAMAHNAKTAVRVSMLAGSRSRASTIVRVVAVYVAALCWAGLPTRAGAENLNAEQYLYAGQGLVGGGGCYYHLDMQFDGNLVLYAGNTAYWATNTVGRGAYAVMQSDGNFVCTTGTIGRCGQPIRMGIPGRTWPCRRMRTS